MAATTQVSEEIAAKANLIKEEANKLFANKKYEEAIEKYTEAIELNPNVAAYYANRAFCNTKLENYGLAIEDGDKAIEVDPKYAKGYYRRGVGKYALSRFKEAAKDFRIVVKLAPNDKDARAKLEDCEKIVQRLAFEAAIASDHDVKRASDTINVQDMIVEDSYDGVRIDDGKVTKEFVDDMIERFLKQKKIHKRYAYQIILQCQEYFAKQPSMVDVDIPVGQKLTICGDVHGQFYDFMNIFKLNGRPSETHAYLFNGDFVDRGTFSLEIILTLFAYKLLYPTGMYLTRGNHETDDMNKVYGFEDEVKVKFSETMFKVFSETFVTLPLAHLVQKKIFVVHGGLSSRDDVTLDEIRAIDRIKKGQPGQEGLMCELLWADPHPLPGRRPSARGVGQRFGPDVTDNFCKMNNIDMIIRSHEVKQEGYQIEHNGKCVTIFSAPNYCDSVGNKGAYINVTCDKEGEYKLDYVQFDAVEHPKVQPYSNRFRGF
ncbi:Serine/threonine-protein phosphatase 5 [Actinomortierella wolfii]|nr:Serine/threonine-protein phosphatase 5 [Actinomortierella wolfii]KAG0240103.1 Serine/threonine-protein phosphatase 5 [Actinomortierella wolfii]